MSNISACKPLNVSLHSRGNVSSGSNDFIFFVINLSVSFWITWPMLITSPCLSLSLPSYTRTIRNARGLVTFLRRIVDSAKMIGQGGDYSVSESCSISFAFHECNLQQYWHVAHYPEVDPAQRDMSVGDNPQSSWIEKVSGSCHEVSGS